MKTYLVGGAVRDRLLGLPVPERDWVVLGMTPEQMLEQGFRPVGRHFPVFLHPVTKEEYALARTERKAAPGHGGFVFHATPEVRLEDDLMRRDLTVNAMAEDADGKLIDPWGGQQDLAAGVLRHVSGAFVEDPLRVLRVARFAARLAPLGFRVAEETLELMARITASGELSTLSAARIWQELIRALATEAPSVFFMVLHRVGALAKLLPLVAEVITDDQGHMMPVVASVDLPAEAATLVQERFAALLVGAAVTVGSPPSSETSDEEVVARVRAQMEGLQPPRVYRDTTLALAHGHRALGLLPGTTASALLDAVLRGEALRRPEGFAILVRVAERLQRAEGANAAHCRRIRRLLAAVPEALVVDTAAWALEKLSGEKIGARVRAVRIERLERLLAEG